MNPLLLRYLPHAIAIVALVGSLWAFGHGRYKAGQAEREAYYGPIIKAVQDASRAAESRHEAQERESIALIESQEKRHAESEKTLRARAAAAERSYARILQDAAARRRTCPEPGATAPPAEPPGGTGELERLGEYAALARAIGERAVRDAERYAACRDFYNAQRAIQSR